MQKEKEQQLNVQVPQELYVEVKKAAIDGQLKLRGLVKAFLGIGLYLRNNLGMAETMQAIREAEPLACLIAARNDLSHRGLSASALTKLGDVIVEAENLLRAPQNEKE